MSNQNKPTRKLSVARLLLYLLITPGILIIVFVAVRLITER